MNNEIVICFRASEDLRRALETIARADRRSLSSAVKLILADYLEKGKGARAQRERRRYPRRTVVFPAYVTTCDDAKGLYGALVLDLSLGGMYLSMPRDCVSKIYEEDEKAEFEASFVVADRNERIRIVCKIERIVSSNGDVYVGASFVDADFANYQCLQQFLMPVHKSREKANEGPSD